MVTVKQFNITQFVAPSGEGGPVYGGKFQMALYDFENGDDPDTTDQFACKNVPPNGYNKSRLCNAQVDALLRQGLSTYDPIKRAATYRTLQALLYKELPIALIFRRAQLNTFSDRLQNQTTSLSGAFWNVGHWRLAAGAKCRGDGARRCHEFVPRLQPAGLSRFGRIRENGHHAARTGPALGRGRLRHRRRVSLDAPHPHGQQYGARRQRHRAAGLYR